MHIQHDSTNRFSTDQMNMLRGLSMHLHRVIPSMRDPLQHSKEFSMSDVECIGYLAFSAEVLIQVSRQHKTV